MVDVFRKKAGYTYIGKDRPMPDMTQVRVWAFMALAVGGVLAWSLNKRT